MLGKMDYYNYQDMIIRRHLFQNGGWESHNEHSRRFIIKAMDHYKPEKITVLGSGWLLDLPLAEMIERTKKICLLDIVHPPEVKKQVGTIKNVELIEFDITGGLIEEVWKKAGRYSILRNLKSLDCITIPEYIPDEDPGMVISLNILTQLESLPVKYLKKRSNIKEEEFVVFSSEIQKKHIDFLNRSKSVLITDYEEVITHKSGIIETIPTLQAVLPEGKFSEKWSWDFDMAGADYFTSKSILNVVALII
jgi:hypothetical protein